MTTILTVLGIILLLVFLIFLGVGLFVVLGVFLLVALVLGGISFLFGDGCTPNINFTSSSYSTSVADPSISELPAKFSACLLGSELGACRKNYTHWDESSQRLIEELARKVKTELGERTDNVTPIKSEKNTVNGDTRVYLEQRVDFEKKTGVIETYTITSDPKDSEYPYKIKDLNWDY